MNCTNKFTITKGMDNEFILTIKQTGTTLPMKIDANDTFVSTLVALDGTNSLDVPTVATDLQNGQITLTVSKATADTLISKKGDAVDLYYAKPTYRLIIDCNTLNNGKFLAKIPFVYVE